jgi:hypothetical protein
MSRSEDAVHSDTSFVCAVSSGNDHCEVINLTYGDTDSVMCTPGRRYEENMQGFAMLAISKLHEEREASYHGSFVLYSSHEYGLTLVEVDSEDQPLEVPEPPMWTVWELNGSNGQAHVYEDALTHEQAVHQAVYAAMMFGLPPTDKNNQRFGPVSVKIIDDGDMELTVKIKNGNTSYAVKKSAVRSPRKAPVFGYMKRA